MTTREAAASLGVSEQRIRQRIARGELTARPIAVDAYKRPTRYHIAPIDLEQIRGRKAGRPRKGSA